MHDNADSVYLDDGDVQFYHGDVVEVLRSLPAGIAQTCVTSPPYWGLRDYGTGEWTGGDTACDHAPRPSGGPSMLQGASQRGRSDVGACRCGARRVDQQLGLEPTPDEYVTRMVGVFREVWRVLRDDGTVWLNIGDSYASGPAGNAPDRPSGFSQKNGRREGGCVDLPRKAFADAGLKPKDLVGIPWRLAFALQADGWYLRSEIIWAKPNPMPESVSDRPTKAHEQVFLLTKAPRYFYDADAVREPPTWSDATGTKNGHERGGYVGGGINDGRTRISVAGGVGCPEGGRNRRSVWTIPTEPFPEAHFATFPQALVEPCIKAGSSERGGCAECGAPWRRVTQIGYENPGNRTTNGDRSLERRHETAGFAVRLERRVETAGWEPSCAHDAPHHPQTVLDPFVGSGTTALVARRLGRRCIGIDLSQEYLEIAARRTQQLSLLGGAS